LNDNNFVPISTSLKKGVQVRVLCEVANEGNLAIVLGDDIRRIAYFIDGIFKNNCFNTELGIGKTFLGSIPYTPDLVGRHILKCVVDAGNMVKESREDNNVKEISFAVVK